MADNPLGIQITSHKPVSGQLPDCRRGLSRWRGGRYRVVSREISGAAYVVWVTEKGDPVTHLRKVMLGELQRRNYSAVTTRDYLRVVTESPSIFGNSPHKLGLNELLTYQA